MCDAVGVAMPCTRIVNEIVVPSIRRPARPNPPESPGPGDSLAPVSWAIAVCALAAEARQKRITRATRTVLRMSFLLLCAANSITGFGSRQWIYKSFTPSGSQSLVAEPRFDCLPACPPRTCRALSLERHLRGELKRARTRRGGRSGEHTAELQSRSDLVCR